MKDTVVGRTVVETAIAVLASYDGTNLDEANLTLSLRTLIVNFVESIRLTAVANHVANFMDSPSGGGPTNFGPLGNLELLIHNWCYLSWVLYEAADDVVQDQQVLAQRLKKFNLSGIEIHNNAFMVAQALGMVLLRGQGHRRRQERSVGDDADGVVAGLTLVEVMDVTVIRIDGENPGDLYGEISIDDSFGTQQVFYRDRSDPQLVGPGQPALLTGPGRAVSAFDGFAIYVNLMDQDADPSPDDEVSSGVVVWNSLEATSDEYDVALHRVIDGAYGRIQLNFAVMSNAVAATVEVVLLDSSEGTPDVYGFVVVVGTSLGEGDYTTKLFDRSHEEVVGVEKGSAVPLHRNVVAVPLTSMLQITVKLLDRNRVFPDEQIAHGDVSFQPMLTGGESDEVRGDHGRVTVRVNWSAWFD